MEIFNEIVIIILIYHCLCFTDYLPDVFARYNVGYSCCVVLLINILVNIIFMLRGLVLSACK